MVEGCYGPRDSEPGRAYLAVPDDLEAEDVMKTLAAADCEVTLVHPAHVHRILS